MRMKMMRLESLVMKVCFDLVQVLTATDSASDDEEEVGENAFMANKRRGEYLFL